MQVAPRLRPRRSGRRRRWGESRWARPKTSAWALPCRWPRPVLDVGRVNALAVRIGDALDDLVLQPLLYMGRGILQPRDPIDDVDGQGESVDLVLDGQLERRVDIPPLFISPDVDVRVVRSAICELVDEPGIAVEVE